MCVIILQVVGALVYLSGELQFLNNSGGEESAVHMLSFAQAVLGKGLYINFEGNTGRSVSNQTTWKHTYDQNISLKVWLQLSDRLHHNIDSVQQVTYQSSMSLSL